MKKIYAALIAVVMLVLSPLTASAGYGSGDLGNWQALSHGTWGNLATADVVFVGDSITAGTYPQQSAWLDAHGISNAGGYWSGRPLHYAVDWALSLSVKPRILVMASGTNDIFEPTVVTGELARLLAGMPSTTRVIVPDVQIARPATVDHTPLADQRNAMWVNAQIRTVIASANVCNWSTGFASSPGRITAYLKPDGVHPSDGAGDDYRAAVIGNCVVAARKRK